VHYKASLKDKEVAFLQRGSQRGRGAGQGGQGAGRGDKNDESVATSDDVSMITGCTRAEGPRTNSKGESHCFHCGGASHWPYECPQLSSKQQAQLHMNLEAGQDEGDAIPTEEGHQLLHVSLVQWGRLPENRAYHDRCSTVTAFKSNQFKGVKTVKGGININCNAGTVVTNKRGNYGRLKVWYVLNGKANIFLMHELEKHYQNHVQ
jgi:hypothetical protein